MWRIPLARAVDSPRAAPTGRAFEEQLREINDALLVSLVRQQELAEKALQAERKLHEEELVRQRQLALTNAVRVSTVGELASGLAHELNQPLASIANLAEACSRHIRAGSADSSKVLELLADISSQSLRASAIIAHLRSLVSKGVSRFRVVNLTSVLRNVPHLVLRDLELARTELRVLLPSGPLPVRADRIQLEQILVNLIHNAVDSIEATGGDERQIELSARADRGKVEVSVRDTGAGVDAAGAARMFDPFFTTKTLGLGMGLALSRSILEAHRGRIWMEQPGDGQPGLIVRFALPLHVPKRRSKSTAA